MASNAVFVDTGAWYALQVPDDRWHAPSAQTMSALLKGGYRAVTSSAVVGETYSLLVRTHGHAAAFRFVDLVRRSQRLQIVLLDAKVEDEAYEILRRFADQSFSYVDGTSFALMRRLRLTLAFAFDRHFAVAGFLRIPVDRGL